MQQKLIWFLRILIVIQSLGYAAKLAAPSALNSYLLGSVGGKLVYELDYAIWFFLLFFRSRFGVWFSSTADFIGTR